MHNVCNLYAFLRRTLESREQFFEARDDQVWHTRSILLVFFFLFSSYLAFLAEILPYLR